MIDVQSVPLWATIVVCVIVAACIAGILIAYVKRRQMRRLIQQSGSYEPRPPRNADRTASSGIDPNKGRPNQGLGA